MTGFTLGSRTILSDSGLAVRTHFYEESLGADGWTFRTSFRTLLGSSSDYEDQQVLVGYTIRLRIVKGGRRRKHRLLDGYSGCLVLDGLITRTDTVPLTVFIWTQERSGGVLKTHHTGIYIIYSVFGFYRVENLIVLNQGRVKAFNLRINDLKSEKTTTNTFLKFRC